MFNDWKGEFDIDLKIGNHKPAFSVNEVTTFMWATFMEVAASVEAFGPGRQIGASASNWGNYYYEGVTAFGDEVNESHGDEGENIADPSYGFATRLVGRPYVSENKDVVAALGLNLLRQAPKADSDASDQDEIRFDVRPEARFLDHKYQKTAKIANVDYWDVYGLELAGKYKKFSWQSELKQPVG